jgi:hypothetical protein
MTSDHGADPLTFLAAKRTAPFDLGRLLGATTNVAAARDASLRASEAEPHNARPLALTSVYSALLGEERAAVSMARRAATMAPTCPETLYLCSAALFIAGSGELAMRYRASAAVLRRPRLEEV